MASLTVRDLDDTIKRALRLRAAENGRSMEAEVRAILADAVTTPASSRGLGTRIRELFGELNGVELDLPERDEAARAADLG